MTFSSKLTPISSPGMEKSKITSLGRFTGGEQEQLRKMKFGFITLDDSLFEELDKKRLHLRL